MFAREMPANVKARDGQPTGRPGDIGRRRLWKRAFQQRTVWKRAVAVGLTVGALQAALHQGSSWVHRDFDYVVLTKSLASPLIGFMTVLFSAAATWVEGQR